MTQSEPTASIVDLSGVAVVIVNWNAGSLLRRCVASLPLRRGLQVVVVDNGSIDDSLAQARPVLDLLSASVVEAKSNLGFGKACNLGASTVDARWLLFLNPDAEANESCLERVVGFMHSTEARDVGVCGVRLIDDDGHVQRRCARAPTVRTFFGHALTLDRWLPSLFPPHYLIDFDHLSNREVDQVMGAFFFVRREVFDQLGGFDERFFVYFEDVDFSLRARQRGWRVWYLAGASAYHKGGGTSDQVRAHRLFYSLRSRLLYGFKHFSTPRAWALVAVSVLVEPLARLGLAMLRRSRKDLINTLLGYHMLWRDRGRWWPRSKRGKPQ